MNGVSIVAQTKTSELCIDDMWLHQRTRTSVDISALARPLTHVCPGPGAHQVIPCPVTRPHHNTVLQQNIIIISLSKQCFLVKSACPVPDCPWLQRPRLPRCLAAGCFRWASWCSPREPSRYPRRMSPPGWSPGDQWRGPGHWSVPRWDPDIKI